MKLQTSKLDRIILSASVIVLATVATVALTYELNFHRTVFPKIYSGNVELSNLSAEEGVMILKKTIGKKSPVITLVDRNGDEKVLDTDSISLGINYEKTVANAWRVGRSGNIIDNQIERIRVFREGKNIPLEMTFDTEALDGAIASIAAEVNKPAIVPVLSINKQALGRKRIVFNQGQDGSILNQEKLRQEIVNNLGKLEEVRIAIPFDDDRIIADNDQIEEIINRAAELLDRNVEIKYKDYSRYINGEELVGIVGFRTKWQENKINEITSQVGDDVDRPARDAKFEFRNQKLVDFVPDVEGLSVDRTKLQSDFITALDTGQNTVELVVYMTAAKIRSGDVNTLGIQELLGEGKSKYAHSIPGRIHNVALATSRINGILVPPGETFSFVQAVGDISAATGYQSAYIIKDGKTILGDGGGVCQVSTTLFRAILKAGLPISERHAHAYRVSYYEQDSDPGLDATVFAPTVDLKFVNDTSKHILIQAAADSKNLTMVVSIYGSNDGRIAKYTKPKIFSQSAPGDDIYTDDPTLAFGLIRQVDYRAWGARVGFDYSVEKNGEIIFSKSFFSNYRPWQAVYLKGSKKQ